MRRSEPLVGTIVTIDVPRHARPLADDDTAALVDGAFHWFREVERTCSRFDPASELHRLCQRPGTPVAVSPLLFEAVRFALKVAASTDGAFDPTVGRRMAALGFNQHYRTHAVAEASTADAVDADWRHVRLDEADKTVTLERPLLLDLGGVAKGLALDLAARELSPLEHFAIDAGGDLFLGGSAVDDRPWAVGIRHPVRDDVLVDRVHVRDLAVCTSGTYERTSLTHPDARHIIDPRSGAFPTDLLSATVVASSAMLADALATTALVLGADAARRLLDAHDVCGVLLTASAERITTKGCTGDVLASI